MKKSGHRNFNLPKVRYQVVKPGPKTWQSAYRLVTLKGQQIPTARDLLWGLEIMPVGKHSAQRTVSTQQVLASIKAKWAFKTIYSILSLQVSIKHTYISHIHEVTVTKYILYHPIYHQITFEIYIFLFVETRKHQ